MLATQQIAQDSEVFTCPVCMNDYNTTNRLPKFLPFCGHTFCQECIKNMMVHNSMVCPLDQKWVSWKPHPNPSSQFPTNFLLRQLIETRKSLQICSIHHQEKNAFCLQHGGPVCVFCKCTKDKNQENSRHKLVHFRRLDAITEIKCSNLQKRKKKEQQILSQFNQEEEDFVQDIQNAFSEIKKMVGDQEKRWISKAREFFRSTREQTEKNFFELEKKIKILKNKRRDEEFFEIINQKHQSSQAKMGMENYQKELQGLRDGLFWMAELAFTDVPRLFESTTFPFETKAPQQLVDKADMKKRSIATFVRKNRCGYDGDREDEDLVVDDAQNEKDYQVKIEEEEEEGLSSQTTVSTYFSYRS